VIVDEVHERSVESDLLLLLLRQLLASPAGRSLKVVLMSATADAALFAGYFASALGKVGPPSFAVRGHVNPPSPNNQVCDCSMIYF
jgi:HrpA-like RNA helicase